MATTKKRYYDCVILGADLEGLLLAFNLQSQGYDVALIDDRHQAGGFTRLNDEKRLPLQAHTKEHLNKLEEILGQKILGNEVDLPPMTFEKKQILPFVGFGKEAAPLFYNDLAPYLAEKSVELLLSPKEWVFLLLEKFQGDFFPNSQITRIEVEEGEVTGVHVNGDVLYTAKRYVSCLPLKKLLTIIPQELLGAKSLQKIVKTPSWGLLCWDIQHSEEVYDKNHNFILPVMEKGEDTGVVLGRFLSPTVSTWKAFYTPSEGPEPVGAVVKKIKKQVKRLFPEALETVVEDRLVATEDLSELTGIKVEENQSLKMLKGLLLASPQLSLERGLDGSFERVSAILSMFPQVEEGVSSDTSSESRIEVAPSP